MRRAVYVLLFCAFVAENGQMYDGKWSTPLQYLDLILLKPSPAKFPLFFFLVFGMLMASLGQSASRTKRAKPMDRAIFGGYAAFALWAVYGVVTGGVANQITWQLFPWIQATTFALLMLATMRTPKHLVTLFNVVLAAGLFRATMGIIFYVFIVRNMPAVNGPPPVITTHDDTTLFVFSFVYMVVRILEHRDRKAWTLAFFGCGELLLAIQLNNRRLAWVSLLGALIIVYAMLPKGKVKRRLNWGMIGLAPILGLYVAIGWGRPERIFKPLKSLSTVTDKEDSSTKSRNVENAGLVVTLTNAGWLVGTGWGHEYTVIDSTYDLTAIFAQWRFVPHNSVLGILAFSGALGFAGMWMLFPVSGYLNARSYRTSKDKYERAIALSGLAQIIIVTNQLYGDMGFVSATTLCLMATGVCAAGRLSVATGAWPVKTSLATQTQAPATLAEGVVVTQGAGPTTNASASAATTTDASARST